MKILILTAEYPPYVIGGIGRHVFELSNLMSENNEVIVLTYGNIAEKLKYTKVIINNLTIYRINKNLLSKNGNENNIYYEQNILARDAINEIFANNDIDLVSLHGYFFGETALYIKKNFNIPLIYHAHTLYQFNETNFEDVNKEFSIIKIIERLLLLESTKIIAISNYLKNVIIEKCKIVSKKIIVIGKGIKINKYENNETTKNRLIDKINLLYVGRISEEKGLEILLFALKEVEKKYKDKFILKIVGTANNNDYLHKVKNIINTLNLNKCIMFLGQKDENELIYEYHNNDILIVPSYLETFGRVVIEGMAAGIPIISSDSGGLDELVINNVNGFKFKSGDYKQLGTYLIASKENYAYALSLSRNAVRYVNAYEIETIFKKTMVIYMEAFHEYFSNITSS